MDKRRSCLALSGLVVIVLLLGGCKPAIKQTDPVSGWTGEAVEMDQEQVYKAKAAAIRFMKEKMLFDVEITEVKPGTANKLNLEGNVTGRSEQRFKISVDTDTWKTSDMSINAEMEKAAEDIIREAFKEALEKSKPSETEKAKIIAQARKTVTDHLKKTYELDVEITSEKLLPTYVSSSVSLAGNVIGQKEQSFSIHVNYKTQETSLFAMSPALVEAIKSKGYNPFK